MMSFLVDYQDHYSYFDRRVSTFNFLRFSDEEWRWYSQSLHCQNRLRHSDYRRLFLECGFCVVEEHCLGGAQEDSESVCRMKLDRRFAHYDVADLAVRAAYFVLTPS